MRWISVAVVLLACRGSSPARGPEIDVAMAAPGFSAELVESEITNPVEDVTARLAHVTRIRSRSAEGSSVVRIDFEPGTDIDAAVTDVQHAIGGVQRQLPPGVQPATISKQGGVIVGRYLLLSTELSEVELTRALDKIVDQIAMGGGVGRVDRCGGQRPVIEIYVHPERLQAFGLDVSAIATAVRDVRGGIDELKALSLGRVKLIDVADVRDRGVSPDCQASFRGRRAPEAIVYAQPGADVDHVRAVVDEIAKRAVPPGLELQIVADVHPVTIGVLPSAEGLERAVGRFTTVVEQRPDAWTVVLDRDRGDALRMIREQLGSRAGVIGVGEPDATLELRGPEHGTLVVAASDIVGRVHPITRVGFESAPTARFEVDLPAAMDLGINVAAIATTLDALRGSQTIRISVLGSGSLDEVTVKSSTGAFVPLSSVVTKSAVSRSEILHDNRQRMIGFRVHADDVPELGPVAGVDIQVVRD